jgi:flagellar hook-length control protein FliK
MAPSAPLPDPAAVSAAVAGPAAAELVDAIAAPAQEAQMRTVRTATTGAPATTPDRAAHTAAPVQTSAPAPIATPPAATTAAPDAPVQAPGPAPAAPQPTPSQVGASAAAANAVALEAPTARHDPQASRPAGRATATDAPSPLLLDGATPARPVQTTFAPAAAAVVAAPANEPPTPAHQQVFAALVPLRGGKSGEHQLTVQLHPAELGPVSIVARFENGELSVTLASSSDAARDALHGAMPQLRNDLQQAGFAGVAIALDAGGDPGRAGRQPAPTPAAPPTAQAAPNRPPDAPPIRSRYAGTSALDRLL